MTEIPLNDKSQNYDLNVNEDFTKKLIFKLIACFIHDFISGMKF